MNILLLEPGYKNKYPPIGLMKLAYYHKEIRNDLVWFQKGEPVSAVSSAVKAKMSSSKYYLHKYDDVQDFINNVNATIENKCWDRVYITTLFTFEWEQTIRIIEYAKSLVDKEKIYLGGILATLMPDELEKATGIKPLCGRLRTSSLLGFEDHVDIDTLIPDYSMLDNIEYIYPDNNAYFTSCTKGCGMKCSFCAVQTLEPTYEPYISITKQIEAINDKYGERQHLMLMDNNVLKSSHLSEIIEDIKSVGFAKGATRVNPKTGKPNQRFVDFNQGLDANLLTEPRAKLLSEIAIKPVRIAFDHVDDRDKYAAAIDIAEQAGLNNLSNYMLYNTPEFKGKGIPRRADTPQDLYERIKVNIELVNKANVRRKKTGEPMLQIYSFPMQYIPLNAKERNYLSDKWSPKEYQAVRRILHISKGVIYQRDTFFKSVWGENVDEFNARLLLPKLYIEECLSANISLASDGTKHKNVKKNEQWIKTWNEWKRLYFDLNTSEKRMFIELISSNKYDIETYVEISSFKLRVIYSHYFTATAFVKFLDDLKTRNISLFLEMQKYLCGPGKDMLQANLLYLSKLKCGENYIDKVKLLLNVYRLNSFSDLRAKQYTFYHEFIEMEETQVNEEKILVTESY